MYRYFFSSFFFLMPYASRYTGFTTALSTIELFITWLRHFFIGCAALWHMSIIIISQLHIYFWFREIPSFFYNGCTSPQHSVKDVLIFCTGRYYVDVPNAKFYTLIDSTFFLQITDAYALSKLFQHFSQS